MIKRGKTWKRRSMIIGRWNKKRVSARDYSCKPHTDNFVFSETLNNEILAIAS